MKIYSHIWSLWFLSIVGFKWKFINDWTDNVRFFKILSVIINLTKHVLNRSIDDDLVTSRVNFCLGLDSVSLLEVLANI